MLHLQHLLQQQPQQQTELLKQHACRWQPASCQLGLSPPSPLINSCLPAGMGLVGLLCAQLGAAAVLLTDYEPAVLTHLAQNATLNGLAQRCSSQQLDWRHPMDSLQPEQLGAWRLVVAADVLYASVVVQPFIDALALLLHEEGERTHTQGWCVY